MPTMILPSFLRSALSGTRTLLICMSFLLVPRAEAASELISVSERFVIYRDLSKLTLEGESARAARVFIDPVRNVSATENAVLHQLAVDTFRSRLQVVMKKNEANHLIQIVTESYVNYAIRNPKRKPAVAYILLSLCKYPIANVATDCENRTYYYFHKYVKQDIFAEVFNMWLKSVSNEQPN